MLSKKLAAVAAVSLITSSAAVAQTAQPLSLSNSPSVERASANSSGQNNLDRRGYGIYIVGAIVLAAIIYGIVKLADHHSNPHSP